MGKYPFSKKELWDAVQVYAERRTDALEASLDPEPLEFSYEFRARIAKISSDADAAIKRRRRIRTRAAAAIIALIVLITAFFSFNTTARAAFVNWFKDFYKEYIVYRLFGETPSENISGLSPEWLPDGFSLTYQELFDNSCSFLYENTDRTAGFILGSNKAYPESAFLISDFEDERNHFTMVIHNYEVDCYVSDDDVSDYVWHDAEGKFFFSMSSSLPHEINVKIIENLKIITK